LQIFTTTKGISLKLSFSTPLCRGAVVLNLLSAGGCPPDCFMFPIYVGLHATTRVQTP